MLYNSEIIRKYEKMVNEWLAELPTDPKKQAVFDYTRKRYTDLEEFVQERKEQQGRALPGKIDLMDIVSSIWNREKAIAQYLFIQMAKQQILEAPVDVAANGIPNMLVMEARNRWNEISDDVEALENKLYDAIQSYHKQMIIQTWQKFRTNYQISDVLRHHGIDTDRKKLGEEFNMMDSHYYMEANSKYGACSKLWVKLYEHKIGKLLLLDVAETHKAAAERMGHKVKWD